MKKSEIIEIINLNELEIDPDDHKTLTKLRDAVINMVFNKNDEGEFYTWEELEEMEMSEICKVYEAWKIGDAPEGTTKSAKMRAIAGIMDFQDKIKEDQQKD